MGSTNFIDSTELSEISRLTIPQRDRGVTRTYYSYPAKFLAKLPRGLILRYSSEGDIVLDPFVGGGTTGLESMLLNRKFIGYDINPFAILISRVKTSYIEPNLLKRELESLLLSSDNNSERLDNILDRDDVICLGAKISQEIEALSFGIRDFNLPSVQRFFTLAMIHSVKIVGRRDFENKKDWRNASILPMFEKKCRKMIREMKYLPKHPQYLPKFVQSSSQNLSRIQNDTIDLIIGSPPYKDKYLEYQQIQIQRRTLQKSKRSDLILKILGAQPLPRSKLCWSGQKGEIYWKTNAKIVEECSRVLKPKKFAFFWTGFKDQTDNDQYTRQLLDTGFRLIATLPVKLSHDRAASSRSTHHGRPTNMMSSDHLFIVIKP